MFYTTTYSSPIGLLTLASDGESLVGLWVEGQKYHGNTILKTMVERDDLKIFTQVKEWLKSYFAGGNPTITHIPLAPLGTVFRQRILGILTEIPYGQLTTYGEIAKRVAIEMGRESMSSQAVGGAVGHNPISIIIPCHRVVGSNGSLTGFASGIETKIKLLQLEGVETSNLFIPKRGSAL
ncbi:MAG: methylated-DNA--[protein]-cysteine S-methyltransferase [Sphaerochaetaceae bacterium]|jgi:methylated-DNA-[protein]-cysteine S-methyltransferase